MARRMRMTITRMHGDGTGGYHPHESPWTMLVPLGVLSLGAVFAGFLFQPCVHRRGGRVLERQRSPINEHLIHAMHEVPLLGEAGRRRS